MPAVRSSVAGWRLVSPERADVHAVPGPGQHLHGRSVMHHKTVVRALGGTQDDVAAAIDQMIEAALSRLSIESQIRAERLQITSVALAPILMPGENQWLAVTILADDRGAP